MKQKFSTAWKSSSQVRKQRKYRANAPLHIQAKMMSANLSKELRKKYSKRSFPVRKGDEVKVMIGKFKKKSGKISVIDRARKRVAIEGLQIKKKDGTKINVWFDCSNLQIQKFELEDRKRAIALERKVCKKTIENLNKKVEEKKEGVKKVEKKIEIKKEEKVEEKKIGKENA